MTGIVGRNDYGKSTILEALAIFFDSADIKPDKSDMNCFSLTERHDKFEIACEFDDLPEALVLDENAQTSLSQEFLLNGEGAFEVVKTFKASTGKHDGTAIRCQHPADKALASLLNLKMMDLKKLGEQFGVTEQVADQRVASQWRQAIRNAAGDVPYQETLLDVGKSAEARRLNSSTASARLRSVFGQKPRRATGRIGSFSAGRHYGVCWSSRTQTIGQI
ncbi:ATP-binding protein [Pseudomonas sp. AK106]